MQKECEALAGTTQYKRGAKQEDAPHWTDCLTAISYLFKRAQAASLQLDWIGNMPRLLHKKGWTAQRISAHDLKIGDLLFVGKKGKLISHLAMALNEKEVFHVAQKGGRVETLDALLTKYRPPQDLDAILSYIDPRTKEPDQKLTTVLVATKKQDMQDQKWHDTQDRKNNSSCKSCYF